ncbi:MAG: TetR/AcrR family transcriptional regulator [Actinomycetota bacterium]
MSDAGIPGRHRGPGRPRSDVAGPALLAATRELVTRHGYEAVSIADIAQAAGTGRQTLYRRWPGKAELVLEAFSEHAVAQVDEGRADVGGSADPDGPDLVCDFLARTFQALAETGPALRSLMAQAQHDPVFGARFREQFIAPRRASLRALLARAQSRGQVRTEVDLDAAVSALYGGLWYRLLLDEPLDLAYAASLAGLVAQAPADGGASADGGTPG